MANQIAMTTALKKAINNISELPAKEQNVIAALLMEELKWNGAFENSQDLLANLASEAVAEYKAKKTKPMNLK
jgi:hypothetical protein